MAERSCTLESLLQFVTDVVAAHYAIHLSGLNGAVIAHDILREFTGFTYEKIGCSRFGDLAKLAEQRGLVRRNMAVRHLELLPGPAVPAVSPSTPPQRFRSIRPEVWRAFVFVSQGSDHYWNRETHHLFWRRSEDNYTPKPNEIPVPSIPTDTQKSWMEDFLSQNPELDKQSAPLSDDRWWEAFPRWLASAAPDKELDWKKFRTRKVLSHITEWARANDVDSERLYASPRGRAWSDQIEPPMSSDREDALRATILSALKHVPMEHLENIAIPLRYLLPYVKVK